MLYKDKEWLYSHYIKQRLTCRHIAMICGCHPRTIHQWLINFGIPRRQGGIAGMHPSEREACLEKLCATLNKYRPTTKGRRLSLETRRKMSLARQGSNAPNWRGGITPQNEIERRKVEYKQWRLAVYKKDKYICQSCGVKCSPKTGLHAHHIKDFANHKELRLDINNGMTLCRSCHNAITSKTSSGHPFYGNKYVTAEKTKSYK